MTKRSKLAGLLFFLFLALSYSTPFIFSKDVVLELTREDGLFESLTAICFFMASIFFFIRFWREGVRNSSLHQKLKKNLFYFIFGIMFFFAAGEEISWGQRIIGFDTPPAIKEINAQKEFNIHNLSVIQHSDFKQEHSTPLNVFFNFNRLFITFYVVYFIIIPIASRYHTFDDFLKNINLPVFPLWFGMFFMINELTCKMIVLNGFKGMRLHEIKECVWAVIILLVSIFAVRKGAAQHDQAF